MASAVIVTAAAATAFVSADVFFGTGVCGIGAAAAAAAVTAAAAALAIAICCSLCNEPTAVCTAFVIIAVIVSMSIDTICFVSFSSAPKFICGGAAAAAAAPAPDGVAAAAGCADAGGVAAADEDVSIVL